MALRDLQGILILGALMVIVLYALGTFTDVGIGYGAGLLWAAFLLCFVREAK